MQLALSADANVAQLFLISSKAAFSCITHPPIVTIVSFPNNFLSSISEALQVASILILGGPPPAAAVSMNDETRSDPSGTAIIAVHPLWKLYTQSGYFAFYV